MTGFWTKEEDDALRRLYPGAPPASVVKVTGRSWHACRCRAAHLGLTRSHARPMATWFGSELVIMRERYEKLSKAELEKLLPRHNWRTIRSRGIKMGLKRPKPASRVSSSRLVRALRQMRIDLGLSIRDLARTKELWATDVSAWERGRRMPSLPNLEYWANALGATIKIAKNHRKTHGNDNAARQGLHQANGAGVQAQGFLDG